MNKEHGVEQEDQLFEESLRKAPRTLWRKIREDGVMAAVMAGLILTAVLFVFRSAKDTIWLRKATVVIDLQGDVSELEYITILPLEITERVVGSRLVYEDIPTADLNGKHIRLIDGHNQQILETAEIHEPQINIHYVLKVIDRDEEGN